MSKTYIYHYYGTYDSLNETVTIDGIYRTSIPCLDMQRYREMKDIIKESHPSPIQLTSLTLLHTLEE